MRITKEKVYLIQPSTTTSDGIYRDFKKKIDEILTKSSFFA